MSAKSGVVQGAAIVIADPVNPFNVLQPNADGSINVGQSTGQYAHIPAVINFAGAGDNQIVAGVVNRTINVMKIVLVVGGATTLTFKDSNGALTGPLSLVANGSITLAFDGAPWWTTGVGAALIINSTNAVAVGGSLQYQLD